MKSPDKTDSFELYDSIQLSQINEGNQLSQDIEDLDLTWHIEHEKMNVTNHDTQSQGSIRTEG